MSLPKRYTPLEYITATGTQYIDTGFKPNSNSRMVMDASVELKATTALFGCRDAAKTNGFCVFMFNTGKFQSDYGTTQLLNTASNVTITAGRHIFDINKNVFLVDGKAAHTSTAQTFSCTYPAFLMMVNSGGAIQNSANFMVGDVYSAQLYDNGTLVRDYLPCMTDAGEVGLWDDANGVFYGNAGTGVFEAGTVILTAPEIPTNFRVESEGNGEVTLAWDAAQRAESYRVFRGDLVLADTEATTATVDAELFATITFSVIAYNAAGESDPVALTYQKVPENPVLYLVTDRTMQDVSAGTEKGYYSAMDLNRVGATVEYLAKRLSAAGMSVSVSPVTDWTDAGWGTPSDMAHYLEQVRVMRDALSLASAPVVPGDLEKFTYTEANQIEQILEMLDAHITNMLSVVDAGWAAGTAYTGLYAKEAY